MAADKPLTEKRFIQLIKELKLVSQDDLAAVEKSLEKHISAEVSSVAKDIIDTADKQHKEMLEHVDNLELNTVKRNEFDALKRKVERYHPTN